jgi:hypothetical protein
MILAAGATLLDAHAVLVVNELNNDALFNFLLAHDIGLLQLLQPTGAAHNCEQACEHDACILEVFLVEVALPAILHPHLHQFFHILYF